GLETRNPPHRSGVFVTVSTRSHREGLGIGNFNPAKNLRHCPKRDLLRRGSSRGRSEPTAFSDSLGDVNPARTAEKRSRGNNAAPPSHQPTVPRSAQVALAAGAGDVVLPLTGVRPAHQDKSSERRLPGSHPHLPIHLP